jgi:hypothetical protein
MVAAVPVGWGETTGLVLDGVSMADTYAYTTDRQARLVLSGWLGNYLVYGSAGGKIYAERLVRRGGFIGLFQTYGWVAATAASIGVDVTFQGLLPGVAPLLRRQSDGGTNREQAEVSYWALGIVKLNFGDPSLGLPGASVDVRGLRVDGRGNIDGQHLNCEPITVGSFIAG